MNKKNRQYLTISTRNSLRPSSQCVFKRVLSNRLYS